MNIIKDKNYLILKFRVIVPPKPSPQELHEKYPTGWVTLYPRKKYYYDEAILDELINEFKRKIAKLKKDDATRMDDRYEYKIVKMREIETEEDLMYEQ